MEEGEDPLMDSRRKIIIRTQLDDRLGPARRQGSRIVFTNGCFDILHAGHVNYLEQASRLGDRLVVALNSDASVARLKGPDRPIQSQSSRQAVLEALRAVDWVVVFDQDTPADLIAQLNPDILVKGGDYTVSQIAGADHVLAHGGQVKILSFKEGCSTSNIIHTIQSKLETES